jgi:putative transposase
MNRIIHALGVPKSSLYYKAKGYPQVRESARKAVAEPLLQAIVQITGNRATYGTPRVRALLQRDHAMSVSAYMVHRCRKEEGLLICRNRRRGGTRPHTSTIAVE